LASLGKEDYPNAGRKLFGVGFEARLKARAETAKTLMDASSAGRGRSQNRFLYRGTSRPFRGSPYRGRGANRAFRNRGTGRFQSRGQPTNFRGMGQQWTSQAPAVEAKICSLKMAPNRGTTDPIWVMGDYRCAIVVPFCLL